MAAKGNWAVILGPTGGVGAACARSLAAKRRLNVFGVHRGHFPDESLTVQQAVEQAGAQCHMRVSGAALHEEVVACADELLQVAGPRSVRVFVHAIANASYGTYTWGKRGTIEPRQVQKTFDCMAHSFMWWTQELMKRDLLAKRARLIALSNPMVDGIVHGWGLIAAAKSALELYVRYLGHELGPRGHCVTLLKFGLVETRAIRIAFSDAEWERVRDEVASVTPFKRLATVEEIGDCVATISGDVGDWFNSCSIDYSCGVASAFANRTFNPG